MSKSTRKSTTATSYQISKDLHLVRQAVEATPTVAVEQPTNHIVVVDCSGSMANDLPKIRRQLQAKLPKLLKADDTFSLIWFSGRNEYGCLIEGERVAGLKDLNDINKQIDRWLKPVGLTGFKEPLVQVEATVREVAKRHAHPFALFFMSDGCDNQWSRAEILQTIKVVTGGTNGYPSIASSTFVEYGYYADRALLSAMAEAAGGVHIHADAFDKYETTFETAMTKRAFGGKRRELGVIGDAIGGFAFAFDADKELVAYEIVRNGVIVVPDTVSEVFYLSPTGIGTQADLAAMAERDALSSGNERDLAPAYAAMSLFAVRMKPEIVYPILKALGDVRFIDMFASCFGKQKYSEFMDAAKMAACDPNQRFVNGRDPNKVPADDAFTVLDLLQVLSEDAETRILLDHPAFEYSRISRGRVDVDEHLTTDEALQIEAIRNQMAGEKSAKRLKELQVEIDTVLAAKRDALRFVADPVENGYEISGLVYNECSPNISVRVRKTGTVDLSSRLELADDAVRAAVPPQFKTHIWRNYSIIAHGLVNVEKLPITTSEATLQKLHAAGVQFESNAVPGYPLIINVKPLPIINRKMVKAVSAKTIIELEWKLLKARAAQKVYKAYQDERYPGVQQQGFAALYTDAGATWLKDQGLTSNGFSPKSVQADSKDFIMGKELLIKLKGCSKLDSVKAVREKIAGNKKLNPCDAFMAQAIADVEAFFTDNPKSVHEKWLTGQTQAQIAATRGLIYQTSQIKFGILVGQTWFTEFKSLDETTLTVRIGGHDVVGTCELREIEIKV